MILASIGVLALGWIVAQYAKRVHAAGSLYDYVTMGFGSRMGGWAGWIYYGGTLAPLLGDRGPRRMVPPRQRASPRSAIDPLLPSWVWSLIYVGARAS